jgi:hypothetical protein
VVHDIQFLRQEGWALAVLGDGENFCVDRCDFVMAAETVRESLRLADLEAKSEGKTAYYRPDFLDALYPFLEAPSEQTSKRLLKAAPHLYSCFRSCSPGGDLCESKRLLSGDVDLSPEQMKQLLGKRLVALSEALAPKFDNVLASTTPAGEVVPQVAAEICALYIHLLARLAFSRSEVRPWVLPPEKLAKTVAEGLERKNVQTSSRGSFAVVFEGLCRDRHVEYSAYRELLPGPGVSPAGTLFWEWGRRLGLKYQGCNPAALQVFVLAVVDGYIVLQDAIAPPLYKGSGG